MGSLTPKKKKKKMGEGFGKRFQGEGRLGLRHDGWVGIARIHGGVPGTGKNTHKDKLIVIEHTFFFFK